MAYNSKKENELVVKQVYAMCNMEKLQRERVARVKEIGLTDKQILKQQVKLDCIKIFVDELNKQIIFESEKRERANKNLLEEVGRVLKNEIDKTYPNLKVFPLDKLIGEDGNILDSTLSSHFDKITQIIKNNDYDNIDKLGYMLLNYSSTLTRNYEESEYYKDLMAVFEANELDRNKNSKNTKSKMVTKLSNDRFIVSVDTLYDFKLGFRKGYRKSLNRIENDFNSKLEEEYENFFNEIMGLGDSYIGDILTQKVHNEEIRDYMKDSEKVKFLFEGMKNNNSKLDLNLLSKLLGEFECETFEQKYAILNENEIYNIMGIGKTGIDTFKQTAMLSQSLGIKLEYFKHERYFAAQIVNEIFDENSKSVEEAVENMAIEKHVDKKEIYEMLTLNDLYDLVPDKDKYTKNMTIETENGNYDFDGFNLYNTTYNYGVVTNSKKDIYEILNVFNDNVDDSSSFIS